MSMSKERDIARYQAVTQNLATSAAEKERWQCELGAFVAAMLGGGFVAYIMSQFDGGFAVRGLVLVAAFFVIWQVGRRMCEQRHAQGDEEAPAAPAPAPAAKPAPAPAPAPAATAAPTPKADPAPTAEPEVAPEDVGTRPAALDAARDGQADDLKKIKGVGPALEKLCNSLGFYHFDQIAAWTDDEVAWVDANLEGFKGRVTRDDWVAQAKILAAGGETEFSSRQ